MGGTDVAARTRYPVWAEGAGLRAKSRVRSVVWLAGGGLTMTGVPKPERLRVA